MWYLFAHDTASDSLIQCDSYAGQSSGGSDINVNLGWTPQWVLFKPNASAAWYILDSQRGVDKKLLPNSNGAEGTTSGVTFTSTGFTVTAGSELAYATGFDVLYVAIRAADVASTTYDSSIKFSGGTAPASPAVGETDVITLDTTDGGTNYYASLGIDGAK